MGEREVGRKRIASERFIPNVQLDLGLSGPGIERQVSAAG
jgi:hypothetical protein